MYSKACLPVSYEYLHSNPRYHIAIFQVPESAPFKLSRPSQLRALLHKFLEGSESYSSSHLFPQYPVSLSLKLSSIRINQTDFSIFPEQFTHLVV